MLAFWLTCLIEALWWLPGLRVVTVRAGGRRPGWALLVLLTWTLNLVTHPVVWRLTQGRDLTTWILAELGAVLVEAVLAGLVLRWWGARNCWLDAVLLSVGANGTTALVGWFWF